MSTRSSIAYISWELDGLSCDLHFYKECFESPDNIYLEVFFQGEKDNYCEVFAMPKEKLIELADQLVRWRGLRKGGE